MDVILLERVEKLGAMGQVVKVKPGFARNYLLPQKKALRATKDNLAQFEAERARLEAANAERRSAAETEAKKHDGLSVVLIRQAGESGQLYGSVNARDIAGALSDAGVTVDRTQVNLETPIKTLGLFDIRVRLHPEVSISVTVNVARSADEAATQAKTGKALVQAEEVEAAPELEEIFEEVPVEKTEDTPEASAEDAPEGEGKTEDA